MLSEEEYYISVASEKSSRVNLFRPKQLTDLIIPNIGMIMNPPFWIKYILYLAKNGYNFQDRRRNKRLFFEVQCQNFQKDKVYENSILFILMLAAIKYNQIFENIKVGVDWCCKKPSEWLFKNDDWPFYCKLLIKYITENKEQNAVSCAYQLFGERFIAKAEDKFTKKFEEIVKNELIIQLMKKTDGKPSVEDAIKLICEFISKVFEKDEDIPKSVLLEPNIIFVQRNLIEDSWEKVQSNKDLEMLSNIDFKKGEHGINKEEVKCLLRLLYKNKEGKRVIHSFILRNFLEHSFGSPAKDNKELYLKAFEKINRKIDELEDFMKEKWNIIPIEHTKELVEEIKVCAVAWELNYFLFSGEKIIKSLQSHLKDKYFNLKMLEDVISKEQQKIDKCLNFSKVFIESLENLQEKRNYLKKIKDFYDYGESKDPKVSKFLGKLIECIEKRYNFLQIFFELLKLSDKFDRKTISNTEVLLIKISDLPEPIFAGEEAFTNWYKILTTTVGI